MMLKFVRESLLEFRRGVEPKDAMGHGIHEMIHDYFKDFYAKKPWDSKDYKINSDNTIDISYFVASNIDNFPPYIQFKNVDTFEINNSPNFTSLAGIPKTATHFRFYHNGIKPTEEEIRNLCNVAKDVELMPHNKFLKYKSNKRYRTLGKIKNRKTIAKDTRGYKLWHMLKYIQNGESKGGRRYKEMVEFIQLFDRGYINPEIRTMSRGNFESLGKYCYDTIRMGHRYILNPDGQDYLKKYDSVFNDGKYSKILESLNFKRGVEPSQAMGHGIYIAKLEIDNGLTVKNDQFEGSTEFTKILHESGVEYKILKQRKGFYRGIIYTVEFKGTKEMLTPVFAFLSQKSEDEIREQLKHWEGDPNQLYHIINYH